MPYSDTDEDYDLGNGPPMPRQVYDWYQKNASPIGDMARQEYERRQQNPQLYVPQTPDYPLQPIANIPSKLYGALDWAGRNVAAPALGQMADTYDTDWSNQPFIGVGEHGEFTGRLPALAGVVTPYLAGGAPGGSATLPAGVKLPGGKYGYPENLEGGYHGTHTVFAPAPENQLGQFMDKFINTGEGAQAYGWGHYVGAKKGTGASYMPSGDAVLHIGDQPWNPFKSGQPKGFESTSAEQTAHDLLMDAPRISSEYGHVPDIQLVIDDLKDSMSRIKEDLYTGYGDNKTNRQYLQRDQDTLDFIQSNQDKFEFKTPGSLYHVEIKPPEESLMHWDKKLTEQEPEVIDKMRSIVEKYAESNHPDPVFAHQDRANVIDQLMNSTGGEAYKRMKSAFQHDRPELTGNGQALSEAMKEAGIPGLRFADQQSRQLFHTKEQMGQTQANITKYQKILDEDLQPGADAYNALMAREGGIDTIHNVRDTITKEIAKEQVDLQMHQKRIRDNSILQFDGKSIKTNDDVSEFVKSDVAKHRALITVLEAKDVDTAINRIKGVIRVAADRDVATSGGDVSVANARYAQELRSKNRIINEKAVEWLENNRDKIKLKEPDITHNYVIFDPKNLNPVHRERNMPKGYI